MNNEKSVLPADFDGVFRFTNFTKSEFKAKWGNIEYTFAPESTSPMIIPGATPEEVQHIRKKFARELAEIEFYKTPKFINMNNVQPGGVPALYTESDLAPFIQRCLEPLPPKPAKAVVLPKKGDESKLSKDSKGRNVTKIVDQNESLLENGAGVIE